MKQEPTSGFARDLSSVSTPGNSGRTLLNETELHRIYCELQDGHRFVLKTVLPNHPQRAFLVELLQREYHLLQQLDNPHILRVWQMPDDSELGPAIGMEYVDGTSLDEWLTTHPSAASRKLVLREVLEAVEYLHERGIIHADIKPQNILVTRDDHVRLIDLSFADKSEYVAQQMGYTSCYAAPEQKTPQQQALTPATDIYALGEIIRLLFPYRYAFVVRRCLRTNPNKRYATIRALRLAINRTVWWQMGVVLLMALALIGGLVAIAEKNHPQEAERTTGFNLDTLHTENTRLYAQFEDSLRRMPYPYREFAAEVSTYFGSRMDTMYQSYRQQYPKHEQEIETDYMSAYSKYLNQSIQARKAYPSIYDAWRQGAISEEEYNRLFNLYYKPIR